MSSFKKSEKLWKWAASALCILLALSLTGCTIPTPGFADYDVSGYIRALLDSSYHGSHEDLMEIAKITEAQAMENNTTTVENAAVHFCNTYDLSPSESQLQELQMIMKQAFALTKYTVKEERRVDTGYYLEVEIAPITNFEGREAEIEKLKTAAQQEATAANTAQPTTVPGDDPDGEEDGDEEDGGSGNAAGSSTAPAVPVGSSERVDVNGLFVDKVLEFCKQELANISYDPDSRTVPLDIRQTDKGELQLDMNQIDVIDMTVVRFSQ